MDERTALLARIFQERLAKQRSSLEAIRESEKRAHESEVCMPACMPACVPDACLKACLVPTFEERLTLPPYHPVRLPVMTWQVRQLKAAFEERLTEAVEKVRAVHATNRDAVSILKKNKKLKDEAARMKREMEMAISGQRDAAARERQRAEEGAAVVEQLMRQLQEKEALLAAGAGGA